MPRTKTQNNKTKLPKRSEIEGLLQISHPLCMGIKIPHLSEDFDYQIPHPPRADKGIKDLGYAGGRC